MTRKDYVLIAHALAAAKPDDLRGRSYGFAWQRCVERMVEALSNEGGYDRNGNRRFDTDRFLRAAGYSS